MNKETKQNIIEGIGFVLMVLSIITLIGAMYQLNEVNKDVRELRTIIRK
jgi:Na+-transporting methylmalonyl-CoA/oxaloacetate decarboxylase gamma subunit